MGDARSLRATLTVTDLTPSRIQASASSMIRLYDSPALAVSEWRNVLQSCQKSQLLPLLYVVNEVLQTSKRNRGNKFLEAFGPVLGGSLRFMCERDPANTEKVRRTAKIWGDRRVFSMRFVGDILAGLENYRIGSTGPGANGDSNVSSSSGSRNQAGGNQQSASNTIMSSGSKSVTPNANDSDESDDNLFGDDNDNSDHDSDMNMDTDANAFGDSGPSLLNVSNFSISKAAMNMNPSKSKEFGAGAKRRRNSGLSTARKTNKKGRTTQDADESSNSKRPKRLQKLSASSFMELVQQLENLDAQYQSISNIISNIKSASDQWCDDEIMEVGDELTDLYSDINRKIDATKSQRKILHKIAEQKQEVESELKRFLLWMRKGLVADDQEINMCVGLEKKLDLLKAVHSDAKERRHEEKVKEANERAEMEQAARKKAKEEELQRSLEEIQNKDGPKEGMVWNKQAREYQYLADATEESWRD